MALLLTILSALALWALLLVLVVGLLLVLKALESVRGYLEKITMGVRAIEWQLAPLGDGIPATAAALTETADALGGTAARLASADVHLAAAAPALRPR